MAGDRIREILQKRKTLKSQITFLKNAFEAKKDNLKPRLDKLTELFNAFFDLNDELSLLDVTTDTSTEFQEIQDKYYEVADLIERSYQSTVNANGSIPSINSNALNEKSDHVHIKLPMAEIPKFDGKFEEWVTFKNSFIAVIDSHEKLNETSKFMYLKTALRGDALSRIAIFHPSAENYRNAWKVLCDTYDLKGVLKDKHLSALIRMPGIERATCGNLQKITSEMQQHIGILQSLDVNVCSEMQYRLLFEKLPRDLINKWEDKHPPSSEIYPTFSELVKFVNEAAFRLAKDETDTRKNDNPSKRDHKHVEQRLSKFRKSNQGVRAFVTNTLNENCVICKAPHVLYQCPEFKILKLQERWAAIRKFNLCRNCLRRHRGDCMFSHCKLCPAKHHTLLHNPDSKPKNLDPQSAKSNRST